MNEACLPLCRLLCGQTTALQVLGKLERGGKLSQLDFGRPVDLPGSANGKEERAVPRVCDEVLAGIEPNRGPQPQRRILSDGLGILHIGEQHRAEATTEIGRMVDFIIRRARSRTGTAASRGRREKSPVW